MQQQPRRSDLAAASWANSPPPRRSKTPPTQRASPRQAKAVPASPASPPPAAPVTPTKRPSIPSPRKSTPRRSSSPGGSSPRVRPTYGTEAYTAQHLKNKALLVDDGLKDPHTSQLSSLQDVDARCALLVNQHVWVGERDGSITLRNQSGDVAHIIERKKGSFVWCLIEVHHHVWAGCSDGFIRVLDSATHAMVAQFARHAGGGGGVHSLTFHAPTNTVFSGSNDFDILAWNATTFDFLLQFHQHGGAVRALAADANHLYSASDDSTIIKWDLSTNQAIQVWPGHSKGVHSLCITDRHLWSGSEDGTIRIWDRATGECIGVANCITGSVDSLLVVGPNVWSAAGSTICIWDSLHLRLLGTYTAHEGYVTTLAIVGKTSNYLVWSAGSDHKAQVWNTLAPTDDASAELKRQIFELSAAAQASRRQAEQLQAELRTKAEEHEALCAEKESAKKKAEELDRKIGLLQKITASLGVNTDDASLASFQGTARPETSPPPTGTVMITFTDVQSSTELWEHFTEDMEKAIAIHNVVMRDGIEKFNGYEVKTEGDAFMCSWHTSLDAVRWCLYMQTKLLETDWPKSLLAHSSAQTERGRTSVIWHGLRVRMGGHVGQPSCQRDPNTGRMDYFGRMVNKSARVGGLGKGGQIVVSDDVLKDLSQYGDVAALLENPVIVNLGERKLKGIAEPTVVHSLVPHPLRERKFPVEEAAAAGAAGAGAAAGEEIMQVEGDHAGDGSKAKSIQYLIFMDRLKKRIKEFPDDIHKLQDELRSAAEAADWLRKALDDSEGSKGELRSRVASLESTNHELTQQAAQHAAQLAAAQLENDRLQARLRAVDEMFKSRLSLLTDVFKLYKKAEGARRADPNVEAVVGEFKSVIHRHYTDDELAHLGSSRHLIAPAGAAGAGSPHSARRSASPESKPRH